MQGTSLKTVVRDSNKNILFGSLLALYIFGMIYGSLLIKSDVNSVWSELEFITNEYRAMQIEQSVITTFCNSFFSSFILVLLPYLFGYSSIGQLGTIVIPFFNGLGLGCALGYLYLNFGLKGVGYSALIVIPHSVVALFALMIACRESIKLSNLFFQSFLPKQEKTVNINIIKLYNIKFIVLLGILLCAALINVATVMLFSKMFR